MSAKRLVFALVALATLGCCQGLFAEASPVSTSRLSRNDMETLLNQLGAQAAARMQKYRDTQSVSEHRDAIEKQASPPQPKRLCIPTDSSLCLLGRFIVVAVWDNPFSDPNTRFAAGALQLTDESGYMWFLSPSDMEIPIKILDFCDQGVFKVFAAGLTDFGVGVGVLDLVSGNQSNYINPDFDQFNTIIDESPPFTCP